MATLLLRLAGPLQSWGTQSRFTTRDTGLEPSKSGVVGLLCAALGLPRSEPVDHLAALRLGVRVEREGSLRLDYHTAGGTHRRGHAYGVAKADGKSGGTVLSRRYYLADADFLVGLEGDAELLATLDAALAVPRWQLFLGRKAFVPGLPIRLPDQPPRGPGLSDQQLEAALERFPWLPEPERPPWQRPARLRLVLETPDGSGEETRLDQPYGAAFRDRTFTVRRVTTRFLRLGDQVPVVEAGTCTSPA